MLCVSATQVGKTFGLACWLLARMAEYRGPHPWWWLAPTYAQVEQGFRLMTAIARSAGVVAGQPVMTPFPRLRLINGALCEARSWEREQNLMGTTIAGGVVDEAGLLTPEAQAAISTRRSSTLGPLRYIGNPGLVAGPFRRLVALAEQDTERRVFSAHRWTWHDKHAALQAENREQAAAYAAFIEQERASLPEFEFRRLYEAEWTEDEAAVFRGIGECVAHGDSALLAPGADQFVLGVDVAQTNDYLCAVSIGLDTRRLELRYRVRGVSYPQAALDLQRLQRELGAPCVVEINGPGIALVQEFDRLGVPYVPFTTTAQSKQEIVLNLAADVQQRRVTLADHAPMPYEFAAFRYRRTPSGNYQYSAPDGEHDDTVMAACLARHGLGHALAAGGYGWV